VGSKVLDAVARLGGWLLCFAVFGVSFGESAVLMDFVIPGEVGMVVAGAAATRNDVSPWLLVAIGSVGSVLGDSFSYVVGRRWGMSLVRRWSWLRRRLEPRFDRAHRYFERRGGRAVFAARWVGALRALVPLVAGTSEMPFRRFLAWDAGAAVLWVTTTIWLGATFGDDIANAVDRIGTGISLVVIGVIVLVVVLRSRGIRPFRRPAGSAPGGGRRRSRDGG
jgi:membrane protein DedA with SNARE-associated domain